MKDKNFKNYLDQIIFEEEDKKHLNSINEKIFEIENEFKLLISSKYKSCKIMDKLVNIICCNSNTVIRREKRI